MRVLLRAAMGFQFFSIVSSLSNYGRPYLESKAFNFSLLFLILLCEESKAKGKFVELSIFLYCFKHVGETLDLDHLDFQFFSIVSICGKHEAC